MPTRDEYIQVIEPILDEFSAKPADAWNGIYRLLLWYESGYPHIVEANELKKMLWGERARMVEGELAKMFDCEPHQVRYRVGRLFHHQSFKRMQIQNPLGIAFTLSLTRLLKKFSGSAGYDFHTEEAIGRSVFIGLKDPPRRASDIVVIRGDDEVAIISAKWSLRHDRLKDMLDECAYFRVVRPSLKFYAATNEYMPARLAKLLIDRCIEDVFHIKRSLVMLVNNDDTRLASIRDLSELFAPFQ